LIYLDYLFTWYVGLCKLKYYITIWNVSLSN
jgi:hypothetical protein